MSRARSSGQSPLTSSLAPAPPSLQWLSLEEGGGCLHVCLESASMAVHGTMQHSLNDQLLKSWPASSCKVGSSFDTQLMFTVRRFTSKQIHGPPKLQVPKSREQGMARNALLS
jgi:hypothetical protein